MHIPTSTLQALGLSEVEIRVYTSLLHRGRSSVSELLPDLSLSRPNLYYNLDLLKEKGLVVEIEGTKRRFEAASPALLKERAQELITDAEEAKQRIDEVVPELMTAFTLSTERPAIQHFDGATGLKTVYQKLLDTKDTLLIFHSPLHRRTEEMKHVIEEQIILQRKAGLKSRVVFHGSWERLSREYVAELRKHGTDPRILYDADIRFPAQILVWDDHVALTTMKKEVTTVLIKNDAIATTFRKIFEALWKQGKADVREAYE